MSLIMDETTIAGVDIDRIQLLCLSTLLTNCMGFVVTYNLYIKLHSIIEMFIEPRPCFDDLALYWLSTSSGVKITQQGFYFYNTPISHATETFSCPRMLNALCNHTETNTIFLPCTAEPLIPVVDVPPPFDRFWRWESQCKKVPTLLSEYHITPCDLNRGTTLLWSEGLLSVQYEMQLPYWPNALMLLIVVWLVINLGESIALVLDVDGSKAQNHSTTVLCLTLVIIVAMYTPEETWITQDERVLYWFVVAYIILYSVYHIKSTNTINVIAGCLILVSSRMYQAHETPYVASLLFLVVSRFVEKGVFSNWKALVSSSVADTWFMWVRLAFMALDVTLFTLCYIHAFLPSIQDPLQAQLYIVGLLFTAACLGGTIGAYAKERHASKL